MIPDLIELPNAGRQPLSRVGGKASALGHLFDFGAPVPPGFVVTPDADLGPAILTAFDKLKVQFVAVRSSAAGEDAQGQSWAGQFESYLYVKRDELLDRIKDCRSSGKSARAQAYSQAGAGMEVAVVVQAMVPSEVAGVMFTANPVTKNRDEIVVEAVYGLGEQLVQGLATPDNYVLAKPAGNIIRQTIVAKPVMLVGSDRGITEHPVPEDRHEQPTLTPERCQDLAQLAVRLEKDFGHPLDIEFAYFQGKLLVLQARPITTL